MQIHLYRIKTTQTYQNLGSKPRKPISGTVWIKIKEELIGGRQIINIVQERYRPFRL